MTGPSDPLALRSTEGGTYPAGEAEEVVEDEARGATIGDAATGAGLAAGRLTVTESVTLDVPSVQETLKVVLPPIVG